MNNITDTLLGISAYELISKTGLCITVGLCYRYKPTQFILKTQFGKQPINYLNYNFPMGMIFIKHKLQVTVNWITNNYYIKKIPETFQLKGKRFGKAVLESVIIYHLMIPVYGWMSYELISSKNKKR